MLRSLALFLLASPVLAQGPALQVEDQLILSPAALTSSFGDSAAVSGDWLAVGVPGEPFPQRNGTVHLYRRTAGTWVFDSKLQNSDNADGHRFGYRIAMDGGRMAVVAPKGSGGFAGFGSVYVFELGTSGWAEIGQADFVTPEAGSEFGFAVDIDGGVLAVGAPGEGFDSGAVHVFEEAAGWSATASLQSGEAPFVTDYGYSLDLDGEVLAVGASRPFTGGQQRAYVYRRAAGSWVEEARLAPTSQASGDFAMSLGLSGDRLLVGVPGGDGVGAALGLVLAYERQATQWSLRQVLAAGDSQLGNRFGESLWIEGSQALVAAPLRAAAYRFGLQGGSWVEQARLYPSDPELTTAPRLVTGSADWALLANPTVGAGRVYAFDAGTPVPGDLYCFGDGGGSACPCGNESRPGSYEGCQNGSGHGSLLYASGSLSAGLDEFELHASAMPFPGVSVLFAGTRSAGDGTAFGDGLLCVAGTLVRLGVRSGSGASWGGGLGTATGSMAGDTLYLQAWFRDTAGSLCGQQFSTTNAVALTLLP